MPRAPSISRDAAWKNIFDRYRLLSKIRSEGYVDLSADAIKAVDGKEPRLMTKVDFRENLPSIMRQEGLSILAIQNGLYRIAKNDPFIDVSRAIATPIESIALTDDIVTIDPFTIQSESAALDIATISAMTHKVFGEATHLTVRGRLRGDLSFGIDGVAYDVSGVQIEVDGGYEGSASLHLIEAKIGFKNNINIRQLLYPQLYWQKKVGAYKGVKSYLFYLHDDIFRFIPYCYDGRIGYLDHTKERAFRFVTQERTPFTLATLQPKGVAVDESVPFPQADSFEKVHDMLLHIARAKETTKEELLLAFDLVPRQIDYYFNVLRWLRLVWQDSRGIGLSKQGEVMVALAFVDRIRALATLCFSEPIVFCYYHKKPISDALFARYKMHSHTTQKRRLQSIASWIDYFEKILEGKKDE